MGAPRIDGKASFPPAEILAPAGDMLALKTAVYHGADAVYLGVGAFNARVKAGNFDLAALKDAVGFSHLFGVRVYAAFNTLLKDAEVTAAADLVEQAAALGTDAFILQDTGLMCELGRRGARLTFHASTQAGIHNLEGAVAAERLGFRRVILSRETTLEDIKRIKSGTGLELEYFVHGALCVSFSGNCYLSGLLTGESGNRGRCLQFCRKNYRLTDGSGKPLKEGCLLSTKDLNLSARLGTLREAGIGSFKIEGRLRRAEYVGEAVRVYKKALNGDLTENDQDRLKTVFNRGGYCEGYLTSPTADVIDPRHPAHIGRSIGTVDRIAQDNAGNARGGDRRLVFIRYADGAEPLAAGDGVKFMRAGKETGSALVQNPDRLTFIGEVRSGDEVRVTSRAALNAQILGQKRQIALSASVRIAAGDRAQYRLTDGKTSVTADGASAVRESKNAPLTREKLGFLSKTGDETLVVSDIALDLGENCFLSVSELKELRRAAVGQWRAEKLKPFAEATAQNDQISGLQADEYFSGLHFLNLPAQKIFVAVDGVRALTEAVLRYADYIVLNPSVYRLDTVQNALARAGAEKLILNLPVPAREKDLTVLREIVASGGVDKYVVNNLYGFELCRGKTVIAGMKMNLLNGRMRGTKIVSVESEKPRPNAINYIYGRVPLMTLTHCPRKNLLGERCAGCAEDGRLLKLTDGHGAEFSYRRIKTTYCFFELLNGVPLDNREVLRYNDCSVLIDLTAEPDPEAKLTEILTVLHSGKTHTHGNYKKELK